HHPIGVYDAGVPRDVFALGDAQPGHFDRLVRLELDELERAGADRVLPHFARSPSNAPAHRIPASGNNMATASWRRSFASRCLAAMRAASSLRRGKRSATAVRSVTVSVAA